MRAVHQDAAIFLVPATLAHHEKAVAAEHSDDVVGVADWEVPAQGRASSISLAFFESLTGVASVGLPCFERIL